MGGGLICLHRRGKILTNSKNSMLESRVILSCLRNGDAPDPGIAVVMLAL